MGDDFENSLWLHVNGRGRVEQVNNLGGYQRSRDFNNGTTGTKERVVDMKRSRCVRFLRAKLKREVK